MMSQWHYDVISGQKDAVFVLLQQEDGCRPKYYIFIEKQGKLMLLHHFR